MSCYLTAGGHETGFVELGIETDAKNAATGLLVLQVGEKLSSAVGE